MALRLILLQESIHLALARLGVPRVLRFLPTHEPVSVCLKR